MTTKLVDEPAKNVVATPKKVKDKEAELRAELEALLQFRREHVPRENHTPCPACNTLIPVQTNQCPQCDSSVAANNALVRESLRRIEEIEAQLNADHTDHVASERPAKTQSFLGRLRYLFNPPSTPEVQKPPLPIVDGPRFLDRVREGDQLIVLARVGSWYQVKTRDSQTGWVYSTIVRKD